MTRQLGVGNGTVGRRPFQALRDRDTAGMWRITVIGGDSRAASPDAPDPTIRFLRERTHDGDVHAIGNIDPLSRAAVLSRGIAGDRGGGSTVASPVDKQVFSLLDGRCLDQPGAVACHPVGATDGWLQIGLP